MTKTPVRLTVTVAVEQYDTLGEARDNNWQDDEILHAVNEVHANRERRRIAERLEEILLDQYLDRSWTGRNLPKIRA